MNYTKRYHYDVTRGIYRGYVDATTAHERVTQLMAQGFTASAIGRAAFVSHDTVTRVAAGTPRLWQATAAALTNVTQAQCIAATPGEGFVPRVGAARRVRALQRIGYTMPAIATHAGLTTRTVHSLVDPTQGSGLVARATHEALADTYRHLCMTPGPDKRTANMGDRRGWPGPLAWDDIDDPAATPDTGPTRGPGRPGLNIEDIEWVIKGGTTNLDALATRLNSTPAAISKALYRAGRIDLVRRLGGVVAA